jgi:hypothetical protein
VRACRENLRWNVRRRGAVGGDCNTSGHTAVRCRKLRGRCNAEQGDALRGERWRARCTNDPEAWVCAVTLGTRAVAGTVWTCAPEARVHERRLLWRSSVHGGVLKARVLVAAQAMRWQNREGTGGQRGVNSDPEARLRERCGGARCRAAGSCTAAGAVASR